MAVLTAHLSADKLRSVVLIHLKSWYAARNAAPSFAGNGFEGVGVDFGQQGREVFCFRRAVCGEVCVWVIILEIISICYF
jgi:hypothetical protein